MMLWVLNFVNTVNDVRNKMLSFQRDYIAESLGTLLTRNLWRKLRGMSAFTNVIVRISKTKTKRLTVGKKIGEKFNLSCLFMNIFRIQNRRFLRFWRGRSRRLRTERRKKFACSDHNARVHIRWTKSVATVVPANVCNRLRLYGNSSLCDRLRSFVIQWKPAFKMPWHRLSIKVASSCLSAPG